MEKTRIAPPKAAAMIESLRGLGYSPATALADIIDNSIAANASQVDLQFCWSGRDSYITILDDGNGMDESALDIAMRLGEKNPLTVRSERDLGRFGVGMKTASFSQCRLLTVASSRGNAISCLRWDLDLLSSDLHGGWLMYEGAEKGSEHLIDALVKNNSPGTLVIWQRLDRILGKAFGEQAFLDLIEDVERHLSMTFHRYLSGAAQELVIRINGRRLKPWDPFLTNHSATWSLPIERISTEVGDVLVQAFVLPHKDKLDPRQYESAGGPDGWTAQQGFYVYRNQRLLVAGSWMGLGAKRAWTKEEAHRLTRIRLDIPNTADAEWKIDIRKSTARPPSAVRDRLKRIAEDARARARSVFAYRGSSGRKDSSAIAHGWKVEHRPGGVRYRIDDDHPAVRMVLDAAGDQLPYIKAMLRVIEETVPVQRVWLDTAEHKETPITGFSDAPLEDILPVMRAVFRNLTGKRGLTPQEARSRMLATEPFDAYPELVMAIAED